MGSAETIRIPQHGHCVICGRAMPFGEKTDSPECGEKLATVNKKRKQMMWMMYGAMAFAVAILILNLTRAA